MADTLHTTLPWEVQSPRKGDGGAGPHDRVIVGNVQDATFSDEGELIEDGSCVVVAHVKGNPTAGGIPEANARLIVRCVNDHPILLRLLTALIVEVRTGREVLTDAEREELDRLYALATDRAATPECPHARK